MNNDDAKQDGSAARSALVLALDEGSLERLTNAFQKPPTRKLTTERLLVLAQIGAIVGAGLWTFHQYFVFEEKKNTLNNRNLELQNEQLKYQESQQQTLKEQARVQLEQSQLALAQQAFQLSQQDNVRKQAEIAVEQGSLAVAAAKLSIEGQSLENKKSHYLGDRLREHRLGHEFDELVVRQLTGDDYLVTASLTLQSNADKPLEVSFNVTQVFVGAPVVMGKGPIAAAHVNPPPNIFNVTLSRPIAWKQVTCAQFVFGSSEKLMSIEEKFGAIDCDEPIRSSGGATASLRKGERSSCSQQFVVRAPKEYWVGVVMNVGLDGASSGRDAWHFVAFDQLGAATKRDGRDETPPPDATTPEAVAKR